MSVQVSNMINGTNDLPGCATHPSVGGCNMHVWLKIASNRVTSLPFIIVHEALQEMEHYIKTPLSNYQCLPICHLKAEAIHHTQTQRIIALLNASYSLFGSLRRLGPRAPAFPSSQSKALCSSKLILFQGKNVSSGYKSPALAHPWWLARYKCLTWGIVSWLSVPSICYLTFSMAYSMGGSDILWKGFEGTTDCAAFYAFLGITPRRKLTFVSLRLILCKLWIVIIL